MKNPYIIDMMVGDFENDKYSLTLTMPLVEQGIKNSEYLGTCLYRDKLFKELDAFKKAIKYDELEKEIQEDMKMMYKDPKKLDEKYGIVRDKYGREISRNGVANPYYISLEKLDEMERQYQEAKQDKDKFQEYLNKLAKEAVEQVKLEYEKNDEIARKRLEVILKNPTINFYELSSNDNKNKR